MVYVYISDVMNPNFLGQTELHIKILTKQTWNLLFELNKNCLEPNKTIKKNLSQINNFITFLLNTQYVDYSYIYLI